VRRVLVILLILTAYVGCSHKGPVQTVPSPGSRPVPAPGTEPVGGPGPPVVPPTDVPAGDLVPAPEPRRGGLIRFLSADASVDRAVIRSNVAEGVVPGGLMLGWRKPREGAPCWILELRPGASLPDGTPVTAADVARFWVDAATRPRRDAAWLLAPFGAPDRSSLDSAIHPVGELIEACPQRPAPDLPERLEHPALWVVGGDAGETMNGPGPFFRGPDGILWPNPGFSGPGPYVDRVEPMIVEGDPTVPLRLGDAHVAVVYGKAASALRRDAGPSGLKLDRLPRWDRTYFLFLNPNKRWVNDPLFRNWLSKAINRDEIVRYLFEGQAQRAFLLSGGESQSDVPKYGPLNPDRPVSPTTVPRLDLAYEASDLYAETLARRIQAVLQTEAVTLSLTPLSLDDLRARLASGDVEVALLDHRPSASDPVLALLESVTWLGPAADNERRALRDASSTIDPARIEQRREAAWNVENKLLESARVMPLIRLEAWIARHPSLAGVNPGPQGVLRFDDAWWLP